MPGCVMHDGLVRKQQKICCKAPRLAWACNGDLHNTKWAGEGLGDLHGAAFRSWELLCWQTAAPAQQLPAPDQMCLPLQACPYT